MSDPLLVVRGLTKAFPGTVALAEVDLDLPAASVTALVGHNGSGKSTLVKVLAGVHREDAGEVTLADATGTPGMHFIHQDLGLVEALSAVENLNLDRGTGWAALAPSSRAAERREAERLLRGFGVRLDVGRPLRDLSPAQRTMVAIARAMSRWEHERQVLVLDEPTAALHDREAEHVLEVTRRIANRGAAVLFISHRLAEVQRLADHVVVLRDGRVVATRERGGFVADDLAALIAGHNLDSDGPRVRTQPATSRPVARLEVSGLRTARLRGADVAVRAGEVVGVSGVVGSGVEELLGAVFGALPVTGGTVRVDGTPVRSGRVVDAIAHGIGFVPADRHRQAGFATHTGRENLTVASLGRLRSRWGSVARRRERTETQHWFDRAEVRPADPERVFAQYSGGNQQKIVISRWMRTAPAVLLLEEPTQGVDVGAQGAIHDLVRRSAADGAAVLVASSDTKELVSLCDRVVVLAEGRVVAELVGADLNEPALVRHTLSSPATGSHQTSTAVTTEELPA